jgi:hypothetical protein
MMFIGAPLVGHRRGNQPNSQVRAHCSGTWMQCQRQCRRIQMWQESHQQPWSFPPRLRQVYLDNGRVRQ